MLAVKGKWLNLINVPVIAAVFLVPLGARAAETPEDVRARFVNDYRQAAIDLRALDTSFEAVYRHYNFVNGEKTYSSPRLTISTPAGMKSTSINSQKPGEVNEVYGSNSEYSFGASKAGDGFVITNMSAPDALQMTAFSRCYRDESGPTYLEIAEDPAFTPVSYTDAVFQGTPCKAFCIRVSKSHPSTGKVLRFDKNFYFDHKSMWVCLGWHAGSTEDRFTYKKVDEFPAPVPTSCSRWVYKAGAAPRCVFGDEIEDFHVITTPPPESEFHLSSVGLSEPVNPRKANSWWNGYMIGAGVLLAVALVFWYARRRVGKVATA